ncbi:MAG: type I secretion C-terminal target domain-containing protein [Caulobacteraceae bacterium]
MDRAGVALAGGGAAVLREWMAAGAQGLVLDIYDAAGALVASRDVGQGASLLGESLTPLAGGGVVAAFTGQTGASSYTSYSVFGADGTQVGAATPSAPVTNLAGYGLPDGSFQIGGQTYDAQGHLTSQAPASGVVAYASGLGGAYLELIDNQLVYFDGSTSSAPLILPGEAAHAVTSAAMATLAGGGVGLAWTDADGAYIATYDPAAHALSAPTLIDVAGSAGVNLVKLSDGGFAVSWTQGGMEKGEAFGAHGEIGPSLYLDGQVTGSLESNGDLTTLNLTSSGAVEQHYALSYAPPDPPQPQYYDDQGQLMPTSGHNWDDVTHSFHSPWQGGQTFSAPLPGPSGVAANGGNNTIIATNGDNSYWIGPTDTVVVPDGVTGTKTIYAWSPEVMPAGVNNLTFYGAGNWAIGNSLGNLIVMGGNDWNYMNGAAGDDVLVGGYGRNTFGVDAGNGSDVIYNFHAWQDAVRFTATSFASFDQVKAAMTQVGNDVVLQIDPTETLTFRGIHVADFTALNFLLPLDTAKLGGLTFDDEFSSLQLLNTTDGSGQWRANFGGDPNSVNDYAIVNNQEKQLYTAPDFKGQGGWDLSAYNPFAIDNGALDITAGKFSTADGQHTWGQAYYSGMLNTKGLFEQQYGYFEMKAELPTDLGSWPAFWLGKDPFDPGTEADVLEHLGMYPNIAYSRADDNGYITGTAFYMPNPSGFHTYGMLWTPTTTSFYVDGTAVMQLATPLSWNSPMYMILNLALGGWGGYIDESGLPAQMKVDYVRVYGLADGSSVVENMTAANGYVEISGPSYTAPANVNTVDLVGSHQTITGNDAGDTFISNDSGNVLIGGAGADFFEVGRGGDSVTGNGGADTFAFGQTPWAPSTITDFHSGQDHLDLTGLLAHLNYTGSDPVADGYIRIVDDASGGAQIWSDLGKANPGEGWYLVATLTGVSSAGLRPGDLIYSGGGTPPDRSVPVEPAVSISAATYTAPAGVTDITLTGSHQTVRGNDLGDTFHSNDTGNSLTGGTGNDVFDLGRGGDLANGGGGDDTFAFAATPWAPGHVLGFNAGDEIDLTGLLAASGYAGSDPVGAGYIKIVDDGSGNAQIWSNLDKVVAGYGWYLVTTVDHVPSAQLQVQGDVVVMSGAGGTGGTDGTGDTGGTGGAGSGGSAVSTSDASYTAPAGVTDITLTGSQQTVHGNNAGDTFHSNNSGNSLLGGTGNDIFDLGRGGDWATGGGGNDAFAFAATPWAAGHITDFNAGDEIDLTGLLAASAYTGSDPVGAGYLKIIDDGSGSAQIWSNLDKVVAGYGWYLVTTVDHVGSALLQVQDSLVVMASSDGAEPAGETSVSTSEANYAAPAGVTDITLTGSAQTVRGNDLGDTFHSNNTGNVLTGGTGSDVFDLGRAGDVASGGAGADTFAFAETPWTGARITDFSTAQDRLDLTGLLSKSGYAGSTPIADGYLRIADDGAGDAQVWSNLDKVSPGLGWYLVATLDHVSASALHVSGAFITG